MRTTLIIIFTLLAVAEMVGSIITTENHRPQTEHVLGACACLLFALAAGVWPTSSWAGVGAVILGFVVSGVGVRHERAAFLRRNADSKALGPARDSARSDQTHREQPRKQ